MKLIIENEDGSVAIEVKKDLNNVESILGGLVVPALRGLTFSDVLIERHIDIESCIDAYTSEISDGTW